MAVAVNEAGDVMVLGQDNAWTPAPRARNPQSGEEVYHDGQAWVPVPSRQAAPAPAPQPATPFSGTISFPDDPGGLNLGYQAPAPAPAGQGQGQSDGEPVDYARKLGLGTRSTLEGVLGLGAPIYDLAALPQRGLNAGLRMATGRDFGLAPTRTGSEWLEAGLDAVGLPRPQSLGEQRAAAVINGMSGTIPTMGAGAVLQGFRMASPMAQGLARMLMPSSGGQAAVQLASGAGAGAASQTASEMGGGPLAQLGAGLVGGGLAGMVGQGIGAGGRALRALSMPFTEAGREGIAANTLLQQSSDPAGLRAQLLAARLDPARRLPDSPVSTAQASMDPGLAMLESGLRSDMTAVPGAAPPAARFANLDMERNAARTAALPPPPPEAAGLRGADLRGQLAAAQEQRTGQVNQAYGTIDPENTSRIPLGGPRQAMDDLMGRYYGPMSGGAPRELQAMADDLGRAGVAPYSSIQNLRARIVRVQNELGTDPRAQSVLIGLKNSLDEAAETAARPREPSSVPMSAADIDRLQAGEGAAQRPDVVQAMAEHAGPPQPVPPWERPPGGNGTGESLASFIVRNGGVRDDGGEVLRALGGTVRTRPGLLNSRGMQLDQMRALAQQEGFIGRVGQDVQGAHGTTMDDLVRALQDELNGPRQSSRVPRDSALVQGVDRELTERGLSLNDPPDDVLRAVRQQPAAGQMPSAAPDGYAPTPDAFTPDQAARWQQAQALRRQQGQDFGADQTGTRAVANILQRGQGGGWNAPDPAVVGHALSSPDAARQVLRAAPGAGPALQQAFMDRAFQATTSGVQDAAGNAMLREPGWRRFWQANQDTAAALFPPEQLGRLNQLAADFAETASPQLAARARQSDTARNLSVANVIGMASRGMIDSRTPGVQALMAPLGAAMRVSGLEGSIRQMLTNAMLDPALAERLLAKASPEAVEQAASYMQRGAGQRIGQAAGDAAGGLMLRTETGTASAEERYRQALAQRLVGDAAGQAPPMADRQRAADLARRLQAPMVATGR